MEYRIYPLEDQSRLDEICNLFAKGLAETTPEYWRWKHFTYNGHPKGMILVAETEDGVLAGMFALQPEWYACANKKILAIQNEDLVIDPIYRGTGLMKKLYSYAKEYYTKLGSVGSISFCNPASYPIFLKYGAEDSGDIYVYNSSKRLLPFNLKKESVEINEWRIEVTGQMPTDLFYSVNESAFQMVKNDLFMRWKFVENPDGPFQWLTIRKNGKLEGYMVVKIVRGKFRRAVNIYDWALQDDLPDELLRAAVKLLQTYGNWVSLWGRYSEHILDKWARAGLKHKSRQGTHFVLHTFGNIAMPDNWQLTRADLDY